MFKDGETLTIRSNMTDAEVYIDGPHETYAIALGGLVEIGLAKKPLWLFDGPSLNNNRKLLIKRRTYIRESL